MRLLVFGLGYAGRQVVARWPGAATGTTRDGRNGTLRFDDEPGVCAAIAAATHVLSSVPPDDAGDPVLMRYGEQLGGRWLGYLSSTGVYGNASGAWVDESAPIRGRRPARNAADAAWLAIGACVFRLPGIYGPARSPLDRVREGKAHRVGLADQVFSRIHVDDIARAVIAAAAQSAPAGAYNIADDLPANQDDVVAYAAALLGVSAPPNVAIETLSPMARSFYAENRRVVNAKAKRVLGWTPAWPDYRLGLRALSATTSPTPASAAPPAASGDQR